MESYCYERNESSEFCNNMEPLTSTSFYFLLVNSINQKPEQPVAPIRDAASAVLVKITINRNCCCGYSCQISFTYGVFKTSMLLNLFAV